MSYKAKAKTLADELPHTPVSNRLTAPELYCRAHGCPLRWSVQNAETTACSYHAWEDAKHWPGITDDLLRMGPFERTVRQDSPTVADMKTRLRPGHRFNSLEGRTP